jgi:lysophospholipase L1-like esterase
VVNASANGYTAHQTWLYLDQVLTPGSRYDLAFLPLQLNDANQGTAPSKMALNLETIIGRLKAEGIVPVLVKENDIHNLSETRWGYPFPDYIAAVDQLAARLQVDLVDGYGPFHAAVVAGVGIDATGLFYENDGVHPNQRGHDILFEAYARWFNR